MYLAEKNFVGQNISSDKIFDTKSKFRQFCPIFAWLLHWNIGQYFRRTKFFVGQDIRHQAEISTILSNEFLSHKVPVLRLHYIRRYLKAGTQGIFVKTYPNQRCSRKVWCWNYYKFLFDFQAYFSLVVFIYTFFL